VAGGRAVDGEAPVAEKERAGHAGRVSDERRTVEVPIEPEQLPPHGRRTLLRSR
jgi:hypothetical protein